ncbi:peptide deformylase [Oerskovia sp. Sa1BUA8]|uniref:Peptide deformylase n=1 Tax=Oerskovia douganii TaxID=2762210 RepID=A0A9D5U9G9_9CELL|nr:peptide deformylase [Oerskovia douganii]MBE7698766.1 peptide deformylase [Oerskovia douganii]
MFTIGRRRPVTYVLGQPVKSFPEIAPEVERGTILRITEIGEPVLHTPAREVTAFGTPELAQLVDDLFTTMFVAEGVGLAAPQVGVDLRVFVYDVEDEEEDRHVGHVVNPVLEVFDGPEDEVEVSDEGCLSIPGAYAPLARPVKAVVRGFDQHGNPVELVGEHFLGRALQHEAQHLDGTLYFDHLTPEAQEAVIAEMHEERAGVLEERRAMSEALGEKPVEYPAEPLR